MTSSSKHILLVTDLWFTHPNGLATVVSNLKRELEGLDHTVTLLEPSQFFTLPFPLYPEMRLALFAGRSVRAKIREGNFDAIHIETEGPLGFWARRACLREGRRFTSAVHGQLHLYARIWLGRAAERFVRGYMMWFHAPSAAILVSTEAMRTQLQASGLEHIFVRPLGVDASFFSRGTCPAALTEPVFIFMGRVSSEKNIEEFLRADLPGTKLVIGDGPDRKKLEARFPAAKFVGYQVGEQLIAWLSCASVCVMPSRTETFGLAMIECLALGIPVAAHDVTGPREIIKSGINGYLDEELARAARQCLTLSPDACRESVRKYTWRASAESFLSILASVHQRGDST